MKQIILTFIIIQNLLVFCKTEDKFENCVQNITQSNSALNTCGYATQINWNIPLNTSDATTMQLCCMSWDLFNCFENIIKIKCGFGDAKYNYTYVKNQMDLNVRRDMSQSCTQYPDLKTCIKLRNNSDITTNSTEVCVGNIFTNENERTFCRNKDVNEWHFPRNASFNDSNYSLKQKCCTIVDTFVCLEEQVINRCKTDIKVTPLMQTYAMSYGLDCNEITDNSSCLKATEVCEYQVLKNITQTNVCQKFGENKWNINGINKIKQKCCTQLSNNECIRNAVQKQCNFQLNTTQIVLQKGIEGCEEYQDIKDCNNSSSIIYFNYILISLSVVSILNYFYSHII